MRSRICWCETLAGTASLGWPSQITISLQTSHWMQRSRCGMCRISAATSAIMAFS